MTISSNDGLGVNRLRAALQRLYNRVVLRDDKPFYLGDDADWGMEYNTTDATLLGPNPTGGVFEDAPNLSPVNFASAYWVADHFTSFDQSDDGKWTSDATGGTAALSANEGGVLVLDGGGSSNNYINLVLSANATPANAPFAMGDGGGSTVAQKKLWFEVKFKSSAATPANCGFAVGLGGLEGSSNILEIIADDGSLQAKDFVGFRAKEDAADEIDFTTAQDGTASDVKANIATHDDSYVRCGFVYDGSTTVTPYIDGSASSTNSVETDATNFPGDEELVPVMCLKEGSGDFDEYIDYIVCIQLL